MWRDYGHIIFRLFARYAYRLAELLLESCTVRLHSALERRLLAMTLLSCARRQSSTWRIFKDKAAQLQMEIEGALPAERRTTALTRGQNCSLEELVKMLLDWIEGTGGNQALRFGSITLSNAAG